MLRIKSLLPAAAAVAALFTAPVARADITIAVVGPMTGHVAAFGDQMKRGAEKAVADLNAKGGVLGQKLRLLIGDDACDPKQAVAVANEMAGRGVALVAGHFCSDSSIPASNVYAETNILQISPASTNPQLTERGLPSVFRTCGRDDQQGGIAAEFIAKNFAGKKIAIIHDKTAYGKGLADETRKALHAKDFKESLYEAITAGERDYSSLVSKLKSNQIDLVYFGGYHPEAGLIVRQMRAQGLQAPLMGGDALVDSQYWGITGPAGEGTLMTFSPDPRKNPANAELVAWFKSQGYEPEGYTIYTYATLQAWAQAANTAGTTDTQKVTEVLKKEKFDTALGTITFDAKGDVTAPGYVVYVWKNGQYDYVK